MLRRGEHAKTAATELLAGALEVKHGKDRAQMVENVVSRAPLDDAECGDHAPTGGQQFDEKAKVRVEFGQG